jgi:pSer/pThr/pTyr-binding forkhead associated (FHA) protein
MPGSVIFLVTRGGQKGHEFEVCGKARCVVGRASDCEVQLPGDLTASRHHCLLDIDHPAVAIHDLGSTNGTYVNGQKAPPLKQTRGKEAPRGWPLKVGDEIRVCSTTLRVWIIDPPAAEDPDESEESFPWETECGADLCAVGC